MIRLAGQQDKIKVVDDQWGHQPLCMIWHLE